MSDLPLRDMLHRLCSKQKIELLFGISYKSILDSICEWYPKKVLEDSCNSVTIEARTVFNF